MSEGKGRPSYSLEESYDPLGIKVEYAKENLIPKESYNLLCKISEYENHFKKYCFNFTQEELLSFLKTIKRISSYRSYRTYLGRFFNWCYINNKTKNNLNIYDLEKEYDLLKTIANNDLKNFYITNIQYLYDMLSSIGADKREKACIILLYKGILSEEIVKLQISNFNFYNNIIEITPERVISIDNETKKIIREYMQETYNINFEDKSYFNKKDNRIFYQLKTTNNRGRKSSRDKLVEDDVRRVRDLLKAQSKYAYKFLQPKTINLSGFMNSIMMLEKNGQTPLKKDFITILKKYSPNTKSYQRIEELYSFYRQYINDLNVGKCTEFTSEYECGIKLGLNKDEKPPKKQGRNLFRSEVGDHNAERGAKGEEALVKLISDKYGEDVVYKIDDRFGYDLYFERENNIERIEVKTMNSLKSDFYITINELQVANFFKEQYFLYLVIWNETEENFSKVIRIPNPIEFFNLGNSTILKPYFIYESKNLYENKMDNCNFSINNISIRLNKNMLNNISHFIFLEKE